MAKFCPQCGRIILDRSIPACPECKAMLPWAVTDQPAAPEPAEPALPAEPAVPAEPGQPAQPPAQQPVQPPVRPPRPFRDPVPSLQELPPGAAESPEPPGPVSPPPYIPPVRSQRPARHQKKPVPEGGDSGTRWIGICCGGLILLIFISAFFAIISEDTFSDSGSYEDVTVPPTSGEDTPTEIAVAIGQTASGDNAQATVWSARKVQAYNWSTSSSDYSYTEEAENGTVYLIIDAEVENTGSETLSPLTWDFSLGDGAGNQYEPGIYYGDESFGYQKELSRNQKARGKILFEIPEDAEDLKLYYDFGTRYGGTQVASWPVG
jgi:hypothetical protein